MTSVPADDTTLLYLVRHGATEANEQLPYVLQGRGIDGPLSPAGREQARAVGRFLGGFPLRAVYSSPLRRAVETASAIAAPHGLAVTPLDSLIECDVGAWEGMNWDAIRAAHPEAYRAFMDDPCANGYLNGESYGDVQRRVAPVFADLLERHAGAAIAVVAHNVVNRAWLALLLGVEPRRVKDLRQTNGCVNVVRRRGAETHVLTLNAHFHVAGARE